MEQAKHVLSGIDFCDGPCHCAEGADALVIVTEWEQFRTLDFARIEAAMKQAVVVDLRNCATCTGPRKWRDSRITALAARAQGGCFHSLPRFFLPGFVMPSPPVGRSQPDGVM
jgi:hypothetical protein